MNRRVAGIETLFIPCSSEYSFIASKYVRDFARFGGADRIGVDGARAGAGQAQGEVRVSDRRAATGRWSGHEPSRRQLGRARHRVAAPPGHRDHRGHPGPAAVVVGQARQQGGGARAARRGLPPPPEETRQARWLLKERDEFLAKMQREGEDILQAARLQAERMVQRTEIVREAQATARRLVEEGRDEARRLRLEAEDYCDQKLAAFEVVLDRTIKTVAAGRERLSIDPAARAGRPRRRASPASSSMTPWAGRTPSSTRTGLDGGRRRRSSGSAAWCGRAGGSRVTGEPVAGARHHPAPPARRPARGTAGRSHRRAVGRRQRGAGHGRGRRRRCASTPSSGASRWPPDPGPLAGRVPALPSPAERASCVCEVRELYRPRQPSHEATRTPDEDTYPLEGDHLDLRPLVRDALLLELPLAPLCQEDCRGLCPTCGADLNLGPCECRPAPDATVGGARRRCGCRRSEDEGAAT